MCGGGGSRCRVKLRHVRALPPLLLTLLTVAPTPAVALPLPPVGTGEGGGGLVMADGVVEVELSLVCELWLALAKVAIVQALEMFEVRSLSCSEK